MKTLVICWNVSRVAWFRAVEKAVLERDPHHRFRWVAVGRAEAIRLSMEGIRAPLLPRDSWDWSDKDLRHELQAEDLTPLVRYDAALSNAPALPVLEQRAKRYLGWYDDFLSRERPNLLLCVNGWRLHTASAVRAARLKGIPVLFVENGYLPYTTVIDPRGVNFNGSLTSMPMSEEVDHRKLEALIDDYHAGRLGRSASIPGWREFLSRGLSSLLSLIPAVNPEKHGEEMTLRDAFETWQGESKRRGAQLDFGQIRKPYVFFPMQVEDDSQLLIHSPWVKSMEQAVKAILEALPRGVQLVVKRHPSDRGRTPLKKIWQLLKQHEGAFLSTGSMADLLRDAEAVVTINSTVGFEALTWYRSVVVLGQAPYAGHGATWDVEHRGALAEKLNDAIRKAPDRAIIDKVLYTALFNYLYPGGWKDPIVDELGPAADAILETSI